MAELPPRGDAEVIAGFDTKGSGVTIDHLSGDQMRSYAREYAGNLTGNFVAGKWVPASGSDVIEVHDPSLGELLGTVPASDAADVDQAVNAAAQSQPEWAGRTPADRTKALLALADLADEHFDELAALEAVDVGKPVGGVIDEELPGVIDSIRYFAGAARVLSAPASQDYLSGVTSVLRREPVGVVAGITPWNYPLLQAIAKIVPALATGNSVVVKPAETTPYSTARFAELSAEVLPPGLLNVVFGRGAAAGDALSRHPLVNLVSFTGSIDTGRKVGMAAADGVKRAVMELGGNSPVLVFDDADLEPALDAISLGGLYNCGQDCMAASRLIVHESVQDQVVEGLTARFERLVVGDALDSQTSMGPLNSAAQLDRVTSKISDLPAHARVETGGGRVDRPGYFFEPTIITGVRQDDEIVQEEIFGPVFTVQTFDDYDEALALANGTRYGLAGSLFTTSLATSTRAQRDLDFGTVWVNTHLVFGPDLPVSGFRQSGVGAENGEVGILEFTRLKHVMVSA